MTRAFKSSRPASVTLPARSYDADLLAILSIPGLTGWWESDRIDTGKGLRWKSRVGSAELIPYRNLPPVVVTGAHGEPALQTGYGNALYSSTDRGAFCVGEGVPLLGATGWTVTMAFRSFSTAQSGEIEGGYLFAARNQQGANPELLATPDNTDTRLVIQSSDGRPMLRGGGTSCQVAIDLVTASRWRIITAYFDDASNKLGLRVDGNTGTQEVTTATSPMPSHAGALSLLFGVFNSSAPLPFYGQTSGIIAASRMLSGDEIDLVEARLATLYGVTLT